MKEQPTDASALQTYRQRLTVLGWFGVIAALGSPLLLGLALADYVDGLGNRYYRPDFPAAETVILSLLSGAGWIMILIGREHYPYTPLAPAAEKDEGRPPETAEQYFGGP